MKIDDGIKIIIKENILPVKLRRINLLRESITDLRNLFPYPLIPGNPEQFGIRLEHMEQCIHCTICHDSVLGKFIIFLRTEIRTLCLEISYIIPALILNNILKFPCKINCRLISRCIII